MHRRSEKQLKETQRPFAKAGPQRVPRPPGLRGIRGTKVFPATLGCCTRYTCPGQGTRCQRGLLLALVVDEEMWQAFAEFQTANAALPGYLKEMPSTFRIAQSNSCCSPVQPRISLDAPTPGDHLRGQKQMTDLQGCRRSRQEVDTKQGYVWLLPYRRAQRVMIAVRRPRNRSQQQSLSHGAQAAGGPWRGSSNR